MTFVLALLLFLQANLEHAQSLLREGKTKEAQEVVSAALATNPNSVPALTLQGRLAMAANNFDLARQSFARAAELAPGSANAQFLLGFFHYVDNDFAQALPALERARKLAPGDARTSLFLALTYDGLAQPARAEELFKEALRQPTVETHIAYGRMLFANGRLDDAQRHVASALAINANSREAHYEQARIYFERGEYVKCVTEAERALKLAGEGVTERQIHFLLSRAYGKSGDSQRAAEHRRFFEAIPPSLIR
jgi:tetratricopeptide (TPR) repeat protein